MSRMDLDDEPTNGLKRTLSDEAEEERSPKRHRPGSPSDSVGLAEFASPPPPDPSICPSPGLGVRSPPFLSDFVERLGTVSRQWSPFRTAAPKPTASSLQASVSTLRVSEGTRSFCASQSPSPSPAPPLKPHPRQALSMSASPLPPPPTWSYRRGFALSLFLVLLAVWWARPRYCPSGLMSESGCIPCDPEGDCTLGILNCKPRSRRIGDRCVPCVVFPEKAPCLPDVALAEASGLALDSVLAALVDNACLQLAQGVPLSRASLQSQILKAVAQQATGLSGDRFEQVWAFTLMSLRQQSVAWSGIAVPHPVHNHWLLWRMPFSAPLPCVVVWLRSLARQALLPAVSITFLSLLLVVLWRTYRRRRGVSEQARFLTEVVLNSLESLAGQPFAVLGVQRTLEEEYGAQLDVAAAWAQVKSAVQGNPNVVVQASDEGPAWAWAVPDGGVDMQ